MPPTRHRQAAPAGRRVWRVVAVAVFVLAGVLFVTSGIASGGLDLRASSVTDLDTVVRQQSDRADDLQQQVSDLTAEVDAMSSQVGGPQVDDVLSQVAELKGPAGYQAVRGPTVTVTLTDTPKDEVEAALKNPKITREDLVVHQQDIQAVANALWTGGAEAMTLQGERVVSTTGIKCVGNTVILHGVPYAPPYVISAMGDPDSLVSALDASDYVTGYKTYVEAFDLGYEVTTDPDARMPAYDGGETLRYARPMTPDTPVR